MKASNAFRNWTVFLTLSGIDMLFFMLVDPWDGSMWVPQLGMLCFINVAIGFSLIWLINYANSPDIPKPVNPKKSIHVHPFRSQAYTLASREVGASSKYDIITHCRYDEATDSIMLWVSHKRTKAESTVYYYNKQDKSM